MISSGTIATTFGSVRSAFRCLASSSGREAAERAGERAIGTHVGTRRDATDGGDRVGAGLEDHDVATGGVETAVHRGLRGRADRGRLDRSRGDVDRRGRGRRRRIGRRGARDDVGRRLRDRIEARARRWGPAGRSPRDPGSGVGLGSTALAEVTTGSTRSVANRKAASRRRMGTPWTGFGGARMETAAATPRSR